MDISPAGPWVAPWAVLAVVLAVVVLGCVGAFLVLRRRNARRPGAEETAPLPGFGDDDLPGFLESPPGSGGQPDAPSGGWPGLAPAPVLQPGPPAGVPARPGRHRTVVVLGASALAALLIVVVLAAVQRSGTPGPGRPGGQHNRGAADLPTVPEAPAPGRPGAGELADATVRPGRGGGAARLTFGGLVLEQRAVGVTATYPEVEVSWNRKQGLAHVQLPTFNCLTTTAPEDPVAAGCVASVTEYADLATPALTVSGDDGVMRLSGRFPTYTRPNGSPPAWTGRVYEFQVRTAPVDGEPREGWVRAEGTIRLGAGQARTLDLPAVTVLRRD